MKPFMNWPSALLLAATLQLGVLQSAKANYVDCTEEVQKCETTYERQCRNEQVCHQVPGQRECHTTSPHQECHTVPGRQECHLVPGDRSCHQEQDCSSGPPSCRTVQECGTNALGEPICKDRQVCEDGGQQCSSHEVCSGSDSRQECSNSGSTQECGLVPGEQQCYDTGSRNECSNEYRCDDQPRQSCHYETVHKQCWVADPPPYNPPTPPYEPPYTPPYEPPYTPPNPPYEPPYQPPYEPPYNPPTPPVNPPQPPPPVPGHNGSESVKELTFEVKNKQIVSISLKDNGQSPTYKTRYFIAINNQSDQRIISQYTDGDGSAKKRTITLIKPLPVNQSYALAIKVVRTGGELVQDVTFIVSKKFIKP